MRRYKRVFATVTGGRKRELLQTRFPDGLDLRASDSSKHLLWKSSCDAALSHLTQ